MASIFRQQYTSKSANGTRIKRKSAHWYIGYTDASGIRRRVRGYTDRKATETLAHQLECKAERIHSGRSDAFEEQLSRPLREHLDDFEANLIAKGKTPRYAKLKAGRARKALDGAGIVLWRELSPSAVTRFIATLDGSSERTRHFYVQSVKAFARWLVRDRRAPSNPMDGLDNVTVTEAAERRAMTDEECAWLIDAATAGPDLLGMSGADRAILYRVALGTGFRASELRSLTAASFDLDADPPTVTVEAVTSKRRKRDVQPIRRDLADALRPYLAGKLPGARAFKMPDKTAKMMRADMAAGREAWIGDAASKPDRKAREASAFLAPVDDRGRALDFHGLRVTYVTRLVTSGANVKVAQELARHSTPTLTLSFYTKLQISDAAAALASVPAIPACTRKTAATAE